MFFNYSTLYSINNKLQVKVLIIYTRNKQTHSIVYTKHVSHNQCEHDCVDVD